MATDTPLPSWVVLDSAVRIAPGAVENEPEWAIKCSHRQAYPYAWRGVKEASASMARDVTLLARLAEPPDLSSLYIRLPADELRRPRFPMPDNGSGGESGGGDGEIRDGGVSLSEGPLLRASVRAADEKLVVLTSTLPDCDRPSFYLIYDATKTSLSMIPLLPSYCSPSFTMRPLSMRRRSGGDGGDGDYSLAIMERTSVLDEQRRDPIDRDVLCLWPPPASAKPLPLSGRRGIEPWQVKQPHFPSQMPGSFVADTVFSFNGQAFWADLAQGVLYCNCDDVLAGGYDVQFHYLGLPMECRLDDVDTCTGRGNPAERRTMSYVGDSIKFVSIGDGLHPELKNAGLPENLPIHPILSTQQDGVLYLVLPAEEKAEEGIAVAVEEEDVAATEQRYLFGLDVCNKRILSSRHLPDSGYLLGFDVFRCLDERCLSPPAVPSTDENGALPIPATRKRKLPSSPNPR
uniref:DUF1618 domain-containing protein n=1 Tax=Oryza punctata TaxID=4537 RepID=A0A0E0KTH9_ORYPU